MLTSTNTGNFTSEEIQIIKDIASDIAYKEVSLAFLICCMTILIVCGAIYLTNYIEKKVKEKREQKDGTNK